MSDYPNVSLKTGFCLLFTRQILVAESDHQHLRWKMEIEPANHNYMKFLITFRLSRISLESLKLFGVEEQLLLFDTVFPCPPYVTTMRAMQFNEDFPALPMKNF